MKNLLIALRRLWSTPAFSLLTVSTLALGVGAVTGAYTLVQSVLLQPLPYSDPDALVRVLAFDQREGQVEWLSWAEATGLHQQSDALQDVAVSTVFPATMKKEGDSERIERGFVSFNYFSLLGVKPVAGSLFLEGDEQQALLSYSLWQQRWAGRTDVVGSSIELDGELYTVAGVLPETVYTHDLGSTPADVWLPQSLERAVSNPHFRIFTVVARLRPGATLDQSRAELEANQRRLAAENPEIYEGWGAHVDPLRASVVGDTESGLLLLFAAVCVILLIVSVNLANLMISRFLGRRQEIATRLALGDSTIGILRDAMLEGGVLASAGGVLGALLAVASLRALPYLVPFALPRQAEIAADTRIIIIALGCAALAMLLFALLPAVGVVRSDLSEALRNAGRGAVGTGARLRRLVIAAQVALSIPLLVGAGLLTQSLLHLGERNLGMQPDGLVSVRVSVPFSQYRESSDRVQVFEQLLEEVRSLPGVESAGATLQVPFVATQADRTRFGFVEAANAAEEEKPRALIQVVTEGYFETLGTRLVEGRMFDATDDADGAPVMIVSRELAERELPGRSAVGLHIETDMTITPDEPKVRRVIGVVEDIPHFGPRSSPEPQIFVPHTQSSWPSMGIVMRTRVAPDAIVALLRSTALDLEPNAIVNDVTTLRAALDTTLGQPRFYSGLLMAFAGAASLLACLGLYGLLTVAVIARKRELGIRAALGASPGSIASLVLRSGLWVTLAGVGAGLVLSVLAVRLMQSLLYGVTALDAPTFAGAAVLLSVLALLAALLPARRAAALNPVAALRSGD